MKSPSSESPSQAVGASIRIGLTVDDIKQAFRDNLVCGMGRLEAVATKHDLYFALAVTVRDRLFHRSVASIENYGGADARYVAYLARYQDHSTRLRDRSKQGCANHAEGAEHEHATPAIDVTRNAAGEHKGAKHQLAKGDGGMTAEDAARSRRMGPNERFATAVLTSFVRLTSTQALKSHQRRPSGVLTADFAKVASVLITVGS
jgi:hypothetical protein